MAQQREPHSDEDPNTSLWFITDGNHVETLAELARVGNCDDIDVSRIYWLGKTAKSLLDMNTNLRVKLFEEREFNKEIKVIVEELQGKLKGSYTSEEIETTVSELSKVIVSHIVKSGEKTSMFDNLKRFIGRILKID